MFSVPTLELQAKLLVSTVFTVFKVARVIYSIYLFLLINVIIHV